MKKGDRFFILKGCAGVGNRLSSLVAAIAYCKKSNRTLYVDWSDGMFGVQGQNVFYQYFELKNIAHVTELFEVSMADTVFPAIWKNHLREPLWNIYGDYHLLPRWQRAWIRALSLNRWQVSNGWYLKNKIPSFSTISLNLKNGDFMPEMRVYPKNIPETVVVGADYAPHFEESLFSQHVILKSELTSTFEKISQNLNIHEQTIGIHVRQTDWTWAANLEFLLKKLSSLDSNASVFLSTDTPAVINRVLEVFPKTILQSKFIPELKSGGLHHYGYEKNNPIVAEKIFLESLIDMYLLSKCGVLWHQEGSTFSKFAHILSGGNQVLVDWSKP